MCGSLVYRCYIGYSTLVFAVFFDESPKWLLAHGRVTDAKLSLCKLRGVTFDGAAQEIQDWQLQIESGDPSFCSL